MREDNKNDKSKQTVTVVDRKHIVKLSVRGNVTKDIENAIWILHT